MSSRRQKLLARVTWHLQSSLKHIPEKSHVITFIIEVVVIDRFHCIEVWVTLEIHKDASSASPFQVRHGSVR